ncbi:MAG: adenosylcobinamide-GDP ribazoletransferase [Desulfobacterota bacterium]|nr:adenosylcobinamide-GDP ribazoletransferase [Thermodesulfobacteriota bacterium]
MKSLLLAISFLTILPVGKGHAVEEKALARSMAFYPAVGLLIGLLLCLGYYLFSLLFPRPIVLWLTIGLLAFLTRGLHLDGWADTLDGLATGGTRQKILEVMKDSRIGTFGVIGLILLLGGKYLCLDQISEPAIFYAFPLMTALGRNSMVLVCYRSAYARSSGGLAKPFADHLTLRELLISSISALGLATGLMGLRGVLAFVGTSLFALLYRLYFIRRLGGVTGDILGGANELSELLFLFLILILGGS